MNELLLKPAFRNGAIYIPESWLTKPPKKPLNQTTKLLLSNCGQLGYTFSEELLSKINQSNPAKKIAIFNLIKEVTGINKNWTPLVKQWNLPTNEGIYDHIITYLANGLARIKGTKLNCGHIIPHNTFPLDRYNGCPYCGTPFKQDELDYNPGQNKLKVLDLWTIEQLKEYQKDLLASPVALDATQAEDLKILLSSFGVEKDSTVEIKETLMLVIDQLVESGKGEQASVFFNSPADILRYLWYKHTGQLQILEPKTIIKRVKGNSIGITSRLKNGNSAEFNEKQKLKLKFNRATCRQYANWINKLDMPVEKQCEIMHSKRGIWVRVIRALRLAEYSKRPGFKQLAALMDAFYNKNYEVTLGKIDSCKKAYDEANTFTLLKQKPGYFARSLFSNMLWFGADTSIKHFEEIADKVPLRLILSLNMYAENYFDKDAKRVVKTLAGKTKAISPNKLLDLYTKDQLTEMKLSIKEVSLKQLKAKYKKVNNESKSIFIDKGLYNIPVAIGDRTEQIQDMPSALMGSRFPVEGDTVRLFLQWGKGLPAQHLDMDLSGFVIYEDKTDFCSYSRLVIPGCKHSGDIQRIPHMSGTAEYIDLNLDELQKTKARYVGFSCNAYTQGSLVPNLVVGWMNSKYPMKISESGVAYDPTAVQHQIRIDKTLHKGLIFGVLDIEKREILWLEMPFAGQVVQNMSQAALEALISKLNNKIKIGELLELKAEAQDLSLMESKENADEVYDMEWATNTARVSKLLM